MMQQSDLLNLYLLTFRGLGYKTLLKALNSQEDLLKYFSRLYPQISQKDYERWYREFTGHLNQNNIRIVSYFDDNYPISLKNISSFPLYLFAKGNLNLLKRNIFAVVGTRNPTQYGLNITSSIVEDLSAHDFVIVSGMAIGIDGYSHQKSLKNGTIAVLGGGLNHIYPSRNIPLYKEIIANDGLVLTEYYPDVEPRSEFFPMRSRIIAGLSSGLLVTEAAENSGSLIAANLAFEYGKNVYAVPADVNRVNSQGCNYLISKNIAKLVKNAQDILEDYFQNFTQDSNLNLSNLDNKTLEILRIIGEGNSDIDQIIEISSNSPSEVMMSLTSLEMEGIIEKQGSEIYLKI